MWPKVCSSQVWKVCSLEFLVTVWQELTVVIQKKPGELASVAFCLSVCYFQHVNVNKHSRSLGDYWLRFLLAHHSSVKQIWKWLVQLYILLPSCVSLKLLGLFIYFQQSCWELPLNIISTHIETYFYSVILDPLTTTKHWMVHGWRHCNYLSSVHSS